MATGLLGLPNELIYYIFSLLPEENLFTTGQVNKRFFEVAHDDLIWRHHCEYSLKFISEDEKACISTYRLWRIAQQKINRHVRELVGDPSDMDIRQISAYGRRALECLTELARPTTEDDDMQILVTKTNAWKLKQSLYAAIAFERISNAVGVRDQPSKEAVNVRRDIEIDRKGMPIEQLLNPYDLIQPIIVPEAREKLEKAIDRLKSSRSANARMSTHLKRLKYEGLMSPRAGNSPLGQTAAIDIVLAYDACRPCAVDFSGPVELRLDEYHRTINEQYKINDMSLPLWSFIAYQLCDMGHVPMLAPTRASFAPYITMDSRPRAPICNAVLYCYIARKSGIDAEPVILRYSTLVRIREPGNVFWLDPSRGFVKRDYKDIVTTARHLHVPVPTPQDVAPASAVNVLKELQKYSVLTNAEQSRDWTGGTQARALSAFSQSLLATHAERKLTINPDYFAHDSAQRWLSAPDDLDIQIFADVLSVRSRMFYMRNIPFDLSQSRQYSKEDMQLLRLSYRAIPGSMPMGKLVTNGLFMGAVMEMDAGRIVVCGTYHDHQEHLVDERFAEADLTGDDVNYSDLQALKLGRKLVTWFASYDREIKRLVPNKRLQSFKDLVQLESTD